MSSPPNILGGKKFSRPELLSSPKEEYEMGTKVNFSPRASVRHVNAPVKDWSVHEIDREERVEIYYAMRDVSSASKTSSYLYLNHVDAYAIHIYFHTFFLLLSLHINLIYNATVCNKGVLLNERNVSKQEKQAAILLIER
jgi:hypothetical protein